MTALLMLLLALASPLAGPPDERFPHLRHARLFPLCDGCHAGIEQAGAPVYPDASVCARCHDGRRAAEVHWSAPAPGRSNLRFVHDTHARVATSATCTSCHGIAGGGRMAVSRPSPEACLACHGGGSHLEGGDRCGKCHLQLTAAPWDAARIAALPQPARHRSPSFLHTHGADAGSAACATCHARESCERCHLNADGVATIAALPRDARVARLVAGKPARYARPTSHDDAWEWQHGASAAASCANCHARASCTACHARGGELIDGIPHATGGVKYARAPRVHAPQFARHHGASAGAESACLGCHERTTCEECHAGRRTQFHAPNFVARHGPEAYGSDLQCSSCHNTEVFCRSCHAGAGRASQGRGAIAFHNAAPLWLLGHGQAARQSLEGCASCHAQSDCARCHSTLGGWGVNPHGSGFNAARLQQQNRLTCLRCHRSGSVNGS